jgi:two-component system LytT family response regulator
MRIHRSYIVNLDQVNTIEKNRVVFSEKIRLPVSDAYQEEFRSFIEKKFLD